MSEVTRYSVAGNLYEGLRPDALFTVVMAHDYDALRVDYLNAVQGRDIAINERDAAEVERNALREALVEARRWIGDGEFSDGLHRDLWTPQYKAAVDKVDEALAASAQEKKPRV
jgi:hypothetical protein